VDFVVSGDNGTFVDRAAAHAIDRWQSHIPLPASHPKRAIGEMAAAGALLSVVCAALRLEKSGGGRALAPVIGLNYQAAAALVSYMK
jgi:hypothetical protein